MPGRVAKSATTTTSTSRRGPRSRASAEPRNSSPVEDVPDEGPSTTLRKHISAVFADAQRSTAGHRKLVINLRKIQESCCYEPQNYTKGRREEQDFDEDDFNIEVLRCVQRVLPVKKSEAAGNRILQFLCLFLKVASEKDNQLQNEDQDTNVVSETFTARLVSAIFKMLLPLLTVKDKVVRFRATQFIAQMIHSFDVIDDEVFHLVRLGLLKRIHDKEASVRQYAVYGLGRLAGEGDGEDAEDSDGSDSGANGVLEKLLDVLQNDPSAEVRRTLLCGLPLTPLVLPYLLERARDLDGATRRALYSRLLPQLGDFRHLSLTHREKLLRWGLRDRDENVRKATARLFRERWIEDCAALPAAPSPTEEDGPHEDGSQEKKHPNQAADPSIDALLELLERIDVTNSGVEGGIALEAMREFWDGRSDYREYVTFEDAYWTELTAESVFVARTFNDYCRAKGEEDGRLIDMLETKMPEVTKFGFYLEQQMNILVEIVRQNAEGADPDGEVDLEQESVEREFVVEQMLQMALTFDYADEVGRRKMFSIMREALCMPEMPEETTKLAVEVLRLVCGDDNGGKGEREFCGVVLEAIAEVHDTIIGEEEEKAGEDGEESFHSARSELSGDAPPTRNGRGRKRQEEDESEEFDEEKAIREIMVNMKCLHIAQCMLQNVQCDLEENVHLVTMLNNLVVPAVRSQEAPIRERGLVCLGLCCLLGKNLAQENLTLFLHCFAKGHPTLQTIALQIIADILATHPSLLAPTITPGDGDETVVAEPSPLLKPVLKAFTKSLKSSDAGVQSTGVQSLSKLMLSQLITDTDLLKNLVISFFDPETSGNAHLRQTLSYFLPVYCHSRIENAERMVQVTAGVIAKLTTMREAFVEDDDAEEGEMVTLNVVGGLLVDWTDPRKIVGAREGKSGTKIEEGVVDAQGQTHLMLAEQILERMVTSQTSKDERKVLFSMLSKLHLGVSSPDPELLRTVFDLVAEAIDTKLATDVTSRNTLTKFQTALLKMVHDVATAERGGEETVFEDTIVPPTPSTVDRLRHRTSLDEDVEMDGYEDDEVTKQLRREMESTRIMDPDNEGTVLEDGTALTVAGADEPRLEDLDMSGLATEADVQELLESFEDGDDEELLE